MRPADRKAPDLSIVMARDPSKQQQKKKKAKFWAAVEALKTAPDGAGWAVKTAPAAGARGRPSKLGKLVKKKDARQRPSKHGKLIKKKRALAAGKACGKQAGWWEAQLARLAAY